MSTLVNLGVFYSSRRYARDIMESPYHTVTEPWWEMHKPRAFSPEPWPPREEPEWDKIWITIGTGSVPPK